MATGELRALRDLGATLGGPPAPWPDDVPEAYREQALTPVLERIATDTEHELALREVRCDEYPCVAVYEVLDGDQAPSGTTEGRYRAALTSALKDALGGPHMASWTWRAGPDDHHMVAIGVAPEEYSGDTLFRVRQRVADIPGAQ